MNPGADDPERIPVVIASGQVTARGDGPESLVTPIELMAQACEEAFGTAPMLRHRVDRLSVVNVMTRTGPAPATELAHSCHLDPAVCETTTIGGNTPQWLVTRAAAEISQGELRVTVIAGAEALRSSRARRAAGFDRPDPGDGLAPDPVVGDDRPGFGPAESAVGLLLPVHVYPLLESVVAARSSPTSEAHRLAMGGLFAPFTRVASGNPFAWFTDVLTAEQIATPSPSNRVVAEPYTKRMTAFLGTDQGAALVVCSLAEARRAGVSDQAVFIWAGAGATDVREVSARPEPGSSPAIAAAGRALFDAAARAASSAPGGPRLGIDDVTFLDLYSCFPSAVELAAAALGIATDDRRGLTVTGGLPYFGGPGNNYTTHGIAEVARLVRERGGLGLATGLGWFITKHSLGLYAGDPPPGGFHVGDTGADQLEIDASAVPVVLELGDPTPGTILAATVVRDRDGTATGAPAIAQLHDGRHVAAAAGDEALRHLACHDVLDAIGAPVLVEGTPPRYVLADA